MPRKERALIRMAYDLEALQAPVWLTLAEHEGSDLRLIARDGGDLLFEIVDAATTGGRAP